MLKQRQRTLLEKKLKQQTLIESIKIESKNLEVLKERQGLIVADLTLKEGALKEEMEKSKTAVRNLNNLISKIIEKDQLNRKIPASRRESIKEREESEKKMLSKKNENSAKNIEKERAIPTIEENTLTKSSKRNFASFKSKLAWPAEGFISDKFGVKNHPVLKGLKVDNNGIDIQTSPNAAVRAVFEGTVLDISQIPGLNNVVAIQHGEFYTVYANLNTINVSINDKVNMNQTLGTVATKDGSPEINFQIWHNFDKLNPEPWLENK
jgi:septal ring factor EnvC (AmiA/AmiB activator)